jgi:hypothetical protein
MFFRIVVGDDLTALQVETGAPAKVKGKAGRDAMGSMNGKSKAGYRAGAEGASDSQQQIDNTSAKAFKLKRKELEIKNAQLNAAQQLDRERSLSVYIKYLEETGKAGSDDHKLAMAKKEAIMKAAAMTSPVKIHLDSGDDVTPAPKRPRLAATNGSAASTGSASSSGGKDHDRENADSEAEDNDGAFSPI